MPGAVVIEISTGVVAALCALAGLLMTLVGVIVRQAVATSRNEASAKAAQAIANEAKDSAASAVVKADQATKDLAMFREKVAREYASREAIRELESKLVAAIERLGDRFDRYVDKEK